MWYLIRGWMKMLDDTFDLFFLPCRLIRWDEWLLYNPRMLTFFIFSCLSWLNYHTFHLKPCSFFIFFDETNNHTIWYFHTFSINIKSLRFFSPKNTCIYLLCGISFCFFLFHSIILVHLLMLFNMFYSNCYYSLFDIRLFYSSKSWNE